MSRPWHIWSVFGICLGVLLAAMGWVSLAALRLDRGQQEAARQAEVEERVRLALWRMDSALATLVVEESARPYHAYASFHPAERAYTKGYASIKQGDVLIPSPLLTYLPTNVLVHFQFTEDGKLTSPQVPLGNERVLAESSYTTAERTQWAGDRLSELQNILNQMAGPDAYEAASSLPRALSFSSRPRTVLNNRDVLANVCANAPTNQMAQIDLGQNPSPAQNRQNKEGQMFRNSKEWNARANNLSQQQGPINQAMAQQVEAQQAPAGPAVAEGPFKAAWLDSALILARRVVENNQVLIQGCWLDWDKLRASLMASVSDLFPAGDLQRIAFVAGENKDTRRLAALPAHLITGQVEIDPLPFWSPIRFSLAVAWSCVLLAGLAVAALLNGAVSLSERRGAFVSAVTHELRTPLTTFKMYSEMLAEGMVPDEEKRRHYLTTLCSEANRLSHLVENVLAYARIERGSARSRVEKISLASLLERVKPRLLQRVEQAGMTLVFDSEAEILKTIVHIDVSVVEQILFNLVDNACKYAAPTASEKLIHLEVAPGGEFTMLRVRDHGPGLSRDGARKLFRPFSKSAPEAANTAPGVGLGLALCRQLSRSMIRSPARKIARGLRALH